LSFHPKFPDVLLNSQTKTHSSGLVVFCKFNPLTLLRFHPTETAFLFRYGNRLLAGHFKEQEVFRAKLEGNLWKSHHKAQQGEGFSSFEGLVIKRMRSDAEPGPTQGENGGGGVWFWGQRGYAKVTRLDGQEIRSTTHTRRGGGGMKERGWGGARRCAYRSGSISNGHPPIRRLCTAATLP